MRPPKGRHGPTKDERVQTAATMQSQMKMFEQQEAIKLHLLNRGVKAFERIARVLELTNGIAPPEDAKPAPASAPTPPPEEKTNGQDKPTVVG